MIGLDTNILVRFFTQDDPIQSPRATEIMERRLTEANPGYVQSRHHRRACLGPQQNLLSL